MRGKGEEEEDGLRGAGLGFGYAPAARWLFRDLDIRIPPGGALGLTGPSGAGKSTLGKILAGFLAPLAGRVELDGRPLPARGLCPVQYIHQHPQLAVNPRWRAGRILCEAHAPSADLLRRLEISADWLHRFPHELSGGELQRLAVARALAPGVRYLVADELSAMLDSLTQAVIWNTLAALRKERGLGLLVISHDARLLERVCDEVRAL